ncbi:MULTISPECIES: redoxin family protein [unclassified Lentimicrobium]|uniref:TlpA family protein disulfide reductase n=1 Tax=unclassified Lentimicrobium TaxID=2677434 RepID=UPI0015561039|nr:MULTISPECIES: redoxin family protein [unclassified Lentimicrobium]NPD46632.1 redoxin family protein [Lentimicrobium sp. S6]NPD84756.1 redoxin family protein [Lentimicrobium sp. L6]
MKKRSIIALAVSMLLFNACTTNYTSNDYLEKVLNNLETIESATYNIVSENWPPGDTVASETYYSFVKEYDYPSDTTIGSKFVRLNGSDTSILEFCYDGEMRALVYKDEKRVVLDSFNVNPKPIRTLTPPFFNYTESILKYALETEDSISLDIKDLGDIVYLKLTIYEENQVEFFGKAFHMPITPYTFGENTSIYEMWIDKTNDLPFKTRREMYHNISVRVRKDYKLNNIDIKDFKASDYFPEDYRIQPYRLGGKRKTKSELIGKEAPDWTLQTGDQLPFSLTDLKSKITMIQFTSVSCGPCKASIPFLKELPSIYKKEDFDFVSIECTSRNSNVLKTYMNRNHFDYKFLLSTKEVLKSYSIGSFPVFFILDENRIIRNVIYGYGKGSTDNEIREAIDKLI